MAVSPTVASAHTTLVSEPKSFNHHTTATTTAFAITRNKPIPIAIMSDNDEVEVESPSGYQVLPKDVTQEIGTIKLFNKWSYEDVEVRDISLT